MSEALGIRLREWNAWPIVLAALAGAFALAGGLAVGDPGSGMLVPVSIVIGLLAVGGVLVWPFAGMLVLAFSVFFLVIVPVNVVDRFANPFDIVLLPLVLVSLMGSVREEARVGDAHEHGQGHDAIRGVARRLSRSAGLYFGLAGASLVLMAIRLGVMPAFTSGLSLVRAAEGLILFPLAMFWLRDERRIRTMLLVVFAAGVCFALVNAFAVFALGAPRAGLAWTPHDLIEPVAGPNEGAIGLLMLWALLTARHAARPSRVHLVLMGLVLLMLPLTQSRSGLLAFATFLLFSPRRLRWRWLLGGAALLLIVPFVVPPEYWIRLSKSLTFQQGSYEVYGFMVRIYSYGAAWRVFLDNALTGVGYLGYRFVSVQYNDLGLILGTAENYFLETLVGLGVVGFAALVLLLRRMYALGTSVLHTVPAGTLAHELARRHGPLLTALLVANMTGDVFVGFTAVGQVALWCALLVRAGHLAIPRTEAA